MSENSKIEWTDHTFNGWIGCTKVSPGCKLCYAETLMDTRYGRVKWGKGNPRQRTSAANWRLPAKWNKAAAIDRQEADNFGNDTYRPPRVFCASLADWLDDEVPIEWLADLLKLIHDTPNLDWLLLTKRPENWAIRLEAALDLWKEHDPVHKSLWHWRYDGCGPENVWLGTSVEDQQRADERIPDLLKIPAKVRFLSVEPLLGPVDLTQNSRRADSDEITDEYDTYGPPLGGVEGIHWVIVGGESGAGARPCSIDWVRSIVQQCKTAGVPAFCKQLGGYPVIDGNPHKIELKHPKGGEMSEWPHDLRVREFPAA